MIENLKPINLKDASYLVAKAQVDLSATTITKSWNKSLSKVKDEIIKTESKDEAEESIISPAYSWM